MPFPQVDIPHPWLRAAGVALALLLAAYVLLPGAAPAPAPVSPLALQLLPVPDDSGQVPVLSRDGGALRLGMPGEPQRIRAQIAFELPPHTGESPQWVVWMRRAPVDRLQLRAGEAWRSPERGFLAPRPEEGPMPVGYLFRLPVAWEGPIRLDMTAGALGMASLRPEVIPEALAERYIQQATIFASVAYASLVTLALMALALFFASRDSGFLSFFAFCAAAVLLLACFNGHLYLLDGSGVLRSLGASGMHAMSLLFEIVSLRILLRYTETPQARPALARAVTNACIGLLLVVGVILAWRARIDWLAAWCVPLAWCAGGAVAVHLLAGAWRRRIPFAAAVLASVLAIVVAGAAWEGAARGIIAGTLWTTYGAQAAIVLCAAMLGAGLISRISKYREQRDREQRARADSERRMYREAVRSELLTVLQSSLRGVPEDAVGPIAFRHLLEHLRQVVPTTTAMAAARGFHGRDTLVVSPSAQMADADADAALGERLPFLRKQLGAGIELQRPVTRAGDTTPVAIEALVALPVRAPAWGLIVLERSGATVFHPDELTIVRELARLALLQADEAIAALHLRHTAEIDSLTGALNRRSLDQALARTFQDAHRRGQPLSVLFIDMDRFKAINDELGHACGDHCLREVAKILAGQLGEDDIFGRYGGEEFLVILPGRQTEMARAIAEQVRDAVERSDIRHEGRALRLTVSIGVATQLLHEALPQAAVERADQALYAAKRGGRNRVGVAPAVFARPASA